MNAPPPPQRPGGWGPPPPGYYGPPPRPQPPRGPWQTYATGQAPPEEESGGTDPRAVLAVGLLVAGLVWFARHRAEEAREAATLHALAKTWNDSDDLTDFKQDAEEA